jgi:phage-related protein
MHPTGHAMWVVEFYERPNGRCPVQEFRDGLNKRTDLPYIDRAFDHLAEYGHRLDRPYASYLRDDIWELRVKTINGQFRFFYFFFEGERIIITNGWHKKSKAKNITDTEIKKAIEYRADFYSRYKGQKR